MAYYGRTVPNQMVGKMSRPAAGLSSYIPAHDINDNLLSDCMDATPYLDSGTRLYANPTTTAPLHAADANNLGRCLIAISDVSANGQEHIVSLVTDDVNVWIKDYNVTTDAYTSVDVSASGLVAALTGFDKFSACLYMTQSKTYVVFSSDAITSLIYYDYATFGTIDTGVYPARIVTHASRIFIIDKDNTLWWCRAGNPFNLGGITDSWPAFANKSTVLEDAGYWVVERERRLEDMCVLNNAIYLFGRQNTYIFQGVNYDTFNLSLLISDFGIRGDWEVNHLCVSRNMAYMIDDGNVYEFNGKDAPRLISHSIFVNTGLTNGVLGGIPQTDLTHIVATRDTLYVYQRWHYAVTEGYVYRTYIYAFDIKTRTWWKLSGFNNGSTTLTDLFSVQLVTSYEMAKVYGVVSDMTATRHWLVYDVIGTKDDIPYIITKAFNTMPSGQETLTALILQIQGTVDTTADLKLSYSLTVNGDDFVEFWHTEDYIFTGDLENIFIPVPVAYIANAHHYRIMLESDGAEAIVYNIERRFRTRGLSR